MKPLIPQTVYVPITEPQERIIDTAVFKYNAASKSKKLLNLVEKKENQYLFTKEEIIELSNYLMDESIKMYTGSYDNLNMNEEQLRLHLLNNLLNQQ